MFISIMGNRGYEPFKKEHAKWRKPLLMLCQEVLGLAEPPSRGCESCVFKNGGELGAVTTENDRVGGCRWERVHTPFAVGFPSVFGMGRGADDHWPVGWLFILCQMGETSASLVFTCIQVMEDLAEMQVMIQQAWKGWEESCISKDLCYLADAATDHTLDVNAREALLHVWFLGRKREGEFEWSHRTSQ